MPLTRGLTTTTAATATGGRPVGRHWAHELLGEDLVVLGGWRTDNRRGLGLVAHSAVQHAPCPVLLVPRDRPPGGPPCTAPPTGPGPSPSWSSSG